MLCLSAYFVFCLPSRSTVEVPGSRHPIVAGICCIFGKQYVLGDINEYLGVSEL